MFVFLCLMERLGMSWRLLDVMGEPPHKNDILISGLTPRSDKHGSKCLAVNDKLKKLCEENNFEFIDNSNIKIKEHLSSDGLHLNLRGTIALSKNFCDAVSL